MNYHEMSIIKNINYRQSGFLLAGIVAVIYVFQFIQGKQQPQLAVVATLLAILAMYEAWPLRKAIDWLIGFGNFMHRYTNPLIFAVIYVLAVIPTALVLKFSGKDVLQLRYDRKTASYWQHPANGKTWKDSFRIQY